MEVITKKIKLFGVTSLFFQVVDASGNVLQVLCSQYEADQWIEQQ